VADSVGTEERYGNEFKMLQDSLFKVWQMYISWFTWYFGINFFASAWILTVEKLKPGFIAPVGFVTTLENLIAVVATWPLGGNSCRSYVAIDLLDLRHHSRLGGFPRTVFSLAQT
jgi:hypothetical protein